MKEGNRPATQPLAQEKTQMLDVSKRLADTVQAIELLKASKLDVPEEAHEMREIMERCVAAEAERDRLRQAIWPGLPRFVPSADFPQQNFYEAVAEAHRCALPRALADDWEQQVDKRFMMSTDNGTGPEFLFRDNGDDTISIALVEDVKAFIRGAMEMQPE